MFFLILILSRVTIDQNVIAGITISTKYLYVTLYEDLVGQTHDSIEYAIAIIHGQGLQQGKPQRSMLDCKSFCLIPIKTHEGSGAKNVAISLDKTASDSVAQPAGVKFL